MAQCQQCTDDPWLNLSSEEPDHERFFSTINFVPPPPLGWEFKSTGCERSCTSTVSQDDADDCALASAQECQDSNLIPPHDPGSPVQPAALYTNVAQTATVRCSDGQVVSGGGENTFSWTVAAGTTVALSQVLANSLAFSMAVLRARQHKICISSQLAGGCKNQEYKQQLRAFGGTPAFWPFSGFLPPSGCTADTLAGDRGSFDPIPYTWSLISGMLPPGLELRPCTGYIKGTPTTPGTYTFIVKAVDAIGSFQTRTITLVILEIATDSLLQDAILNEVYFQQLSQTGSGDIGTWTIIDGSLPPGLTMDSTGTIFGVPTGPLAGYQFRVKVTTNP